MSPAGATPLRFSFPWARRDRPTPHSLAGRTDEDEDAEPGGAAAPTLFSVCRPVVPSRFSRRRCTETEAWRLPVPYVFRLPGDDR